ncbi:DUF4878 domain-containing protein [Gordonia amarae]|jgi:hypothetical protein|uniref:Low molecular weight antigen MTB12-like C-terminal domain-containing protein n=2 Tax=Gordonia amarae TaxID=36821 RepID=G7GNH9_9ACTN|nr:MULTISPECIES: hypothetical protein [Gordonia]MCB1296312.1 DUF4878 domain-containing protein [Gordonia sp. (in: high G+C Gram-positive bacteria)]MCS3880320.1 hypothetical protein [Gordonia amarae]QHN18667.1 DUF4878 domain-containing protein [Gordonia amarae]QHN23142.1 DUF4878 domain-containing protein [Gordonia amarae]QHN32043.1 DUF4878 domain-containing protein [Gordonia amarae]
MRIRQSAAAVAIAGAVVLGIGACSDDADDTSTSASTSQAADASAPASGSAPADESGAETPASELTSESAQQILRVAVDAKSSKEDVEKVVDTTIPGTVMMVQAYAKASNAAGYTPDIYTVKSVAVTGDKAEATIAVKSPHAPMPVDVKLNYAKIDGQWKLSSDAVKMLASFGQQYGG